MPDVTLTAEQLRLVQRGAVVVRDQPAIFEVTGPGVVPCLQGLLTNDVVQPGDRAVVYGALLTPKGMIVTDCWVLRHGERAVLVVPAAGRQQALDIFRRSLPPRLARVRDAGTDAGVAWLVGEAALDLAARAGLTPPSDGPGRLAEHLTPAGSVVLAVPPSGSWFQALLVGPLAAVDAAVAALEQAGATRGTDAELTAARVLGGWPALGAEIDEKTLPQEVRFDEIGGVSYTKGCYTGQETVARLHFRGHPNRHLRGLVWDREPPPGPRAILSGDRDVGTIRSTLTVDGRTIGLTVLRREVQVGEEVLAGGRGACVVSLPFGADALAAPVRG